MRVAWATADDVLSVTGVDLSGTPGVVAAASSDVSMHTGVLDTAAVYTRDEEWLRQATCWQAVWLAGNPGNVERASVTSVSQDGMSASYVDDTAVILAPRARRCLKNLSWMGSRSVRVTRRGGPRRGLRSDADFLANDDPDEQWAPMGGG